jgi:hypothetical protein
MSDRDRKALFDKAPFPRWFTLLVLALFVARAAIIAFATEIF